MAIPVTHEPGPGQRPGRIHTGRDGERHRGRRRGFSQKAKVGILLAELEGREEKSLVRVGFMLAGEQ